MYFIYFLSHPQAWHLALHWKRCFWSVPFSPPISNALIFVDVFYQYQSPIHICSFSKSSYPPLPIAIAPRNPVHYKRPCDQRVLSSLCDLLLREASFRRSILAAVSIRLPPASVRHYCTGCSIHTFFVANWPSSSRANRTRLELVSILSCPSLLPDHPAHPIGVPHPCNCLWHELIFIPVRTTLASTFTAASFDWRNRLAKSTGEIDRPLLRSPWLAEPSI